MPQKKQSKRSKQNTPSETSRTAKALEEIIRCWPSEAAFARDAGMNRGLVYMLRKGTTKITPDSVGRALRALENLSPDDPTLGGNEEAWKAKARLISAYFHDISAQIAGAHQPADEVYRAIEVDYPPVD